MKSFKRRTALRSAINSDDEMLFSGMRLRWKNLTQPEKVVSVCIVLVPLWWAMGWGYFLLLFTLSLIGYHVWHQKSLGLHKPNWTVLSAIAFAIYTFFSLYLYNSLNNIPLPPSAILLILSAWLCPAFLLWYIDSHQLRVKFSVVAWSFTVVVIQMLVFWLYIYVVLRQGTFTTSPTMLAYLLGGVRGEWQPGAGNGNYLWPYVSADISIPGMARYSFFFPGPEALATVVGFICLLALDIKKRSWSWLLFAGAGFLLLLSGTRSSWVAIAGVLALRCFLVFGKTLGLQFVLVLVAVLSFSVFSLPPITHAVFNTTSDTAAATGNMRADSTEVRSEIYDRTLHEIMNADDQHLLFGRVVRGETVLPGYAPAQIGSHSFLLGTLLYRSGLVGTTLFLSYWISLIYWFRTSRSSKPSSSVLTLLFFTLTFCVMELEPPVPLITLIYAITAIHTHQSLPSPRFQTRSMIARNSR